VAVRPKLLDLFCGAGGCSVGYERAGFDVTGVDIAPQPRYPYEFHQADAMTYPLDGFDVIHASPPCQAFTSLKDMHNALEHADLLTPMRQRLIAWGGPYVIENVPGAPIREPLVLCGTSFGLGAAGAELRRHRLFEHNWPLTSLVPPCGHGQRPRVIGVYGGHGRDRRRLVNTQDFPTTARAEAMGIDWMTGNELSQAIPPAYTEFIGRQLLEHLERAA
jgi:DNA (cytosine-5)-methyltransferase 1